MKKTFKGVFITIVSLIIAHSIFSQNRVVVDYTSDETSMIKIGDTSVMKLIGNVYFYHNETIINCDTAYYYYSTNKFIGIGHVIVNKDSLYIYGEKITYNRDANAAKVLSELVKVVDSTTVMYTRNLDFNTETGIATYYNGATITQKDNLLESINGFYDTKRKLIMLRNRVSVKNKDYSIKTDSLDYSTDLERVLFNNTTYIWRENGDFLKSDKGSYTNRSNIYDFYENSYVMTKEQELWSDTLTYYAHINQVILRNNIQINDTVKKVVSFGDYGQYWTVSEKVLLTKKPSILMYERDKPDTSFMRADTLFMRKYFEKSNLPDMANVSDSLKTMMKEQSDSISIDSTLVKHFTGNESADAIPLGRKAEAVLTADTLQTTVADTLPIKDSLINDSISVVKDSVVLTIKQLKKKAREERQLARKEKFLQWLRDGGMEVVMDTLIKKDTINADTSGIKTEISLDTTSIIEIKNTPDSTDYIIRGFGNVKLFRRDVQMICDSLIAESVDSTITNMGVPILWNTNNQITAGRIRSYIKDGAVYRSRLFNVPIVAQEVDSGMYNQMKGDYMDAMYRENMIYRIYVNDASQALYYKDGTEEGRKKIDGLVVASSVNMIIDIDNNDISYIKMFQDIETTTYPIKKIPASQTRILDGFEWKIELRPTKEDVFDRVVRRSIRKEMSDVSRPTFYITEAIDNQKKILINDKRWRDRRELIPLSRKFFKVE